jgi:signal transduction histidine kinase
VESNRDTQEFATTVAHVLQSPLNAISLSAREIEALVSDSQQPEAARWLELITASVERMNQLIRRASDYAQVDPTGPAPAAWVDCGAAVNQCLGVLSSEVAGSGASITVDPMPPVQGDAGEIEQVFRNLIGNAITQRRPDRPCRIRVSSSASDNGWVFCVSDNGVGVAAADAERIFHPFVRVRSDTGRAGIGLAICRRIVERHGGRIWVESNLEGGANFYFTLAARSGSSEPSA